MNKFMLYSEMQLILCKVNVGLCSLFAYLEFYVPIFLPFELFLLFLFVTQSQTCFLYSSMSDILVTEVSSDLGDTIFGYLESLVVGLLGYEEAVFHQFLQCGVEVLQCERVGVKVKVVLVTIKSLEQFVALIQADDVEEFPLGDRLLER